MTGALETVGLGRRYRTTWGLRDCSLTVPEGSITGLVGPNGAGKSTLLRLAAGISRPTTGTVSIFGQEVRPNFTAHLTRIGYFDQLRPLYAGFRVDEMLGLGRRLNPSWDDVSARQWLDDLGISVKDKISRLSLGQQAEVALTVCMGKRPDLLLLDEPVASLDPLARRQLLSTLMGTVAERGTTVLLSSHIVSELEPVCDYLIILSASHVQITGSIEWMLANHRVLVGPRDGESPSGVDVISSAATGRQVTLLVRGMASDLGPDWQDLQPGLDEVVLAYLAQPPSGRSTSPVDRLPEPGEPS